MTIAGVGMVSDSFSSSSFLFLSFSFPQFRSIQKKKAIRDDSYNSFFLTPIPPNLGERARADDDHKKKKRAHKKEIAFDLVFFTREISPRSVFKRRRARALAFLFDRFLFLFFYSFLQLSPSGVDQARWDKKRREKERLPDLCVFFSLSLSFDLYLTTTVQLRRANAPRPGMGERFLLQERRG